MARRIVSFTTLTPTATGDGTTLTSASFPFLLQGGSTTQIVKLWEVSINGQAASSSSPTFMLLSRDATVAVSNTTSAGQTDAPLDPATATLTAPPLVGATNTTLPIRSSTSHLANCSLNAFGGVYFWRANRLEECFSVLGNAASFGEISLSAFTGGTPGAIGCHGIYEPL